MIPPRIPNEEGLANGVRYRVSACRRRLRVSRNSDRSKRSIQRDEERIQFDDDASAGRDNSGVENASSSKKDEAKKT